MANNLGERTSKEKTYDKGNVSESIIMSAYLKAGFTVSIPFGTGAPYDLIVDNGSRLYRVQIKTAGFTTGAFFTRVNAGCERLTRMPPDFIQKRK